MSKRLNASAKDVDDAVDPIMNEIKKSHLIGGFDPVLVKPLLEKLFLKGYRQGYDTKAAQVELHEFRKKNPNKK